MKKLIIFLIRKRLGLKKNEIFRFNNQKSKTDVYFFTDEGLMKIIDHDCYRPIPSNVSLNWLLDDRCVLEYLACVHDKDIWD